MNIYKITKDQIIGNQFFYAGNYIIHKNTKGINYINNPRPISYDDLLKLRFLKIIFRL